MNATARQHNPPQPTSRLIVPGSAKIVVGLLLLVALGVVLYFFSGWKSDQIDGTYGRQKGYLGAKSVNGTAVLAQLFRERGARVSSWKRLSPRLRNAEVVVWFPDDFGPPSEEQIEWFEQWFNMRAGHPKTLIYVGRDYDGQIAYWRQVVGEAPADQVGEIQRRIARAAAGLDSARNGLESEEKNRWFHVRRNLPPRSVDVLRGPWSDGVDASKLEIELASRFDPAESSSEWDYSIEVMLAAPASGASSSEDDALVTRLAYSGDSDYESQVFVITNGSFLLNLPLVNHEHRKLAAKLIDASGDAEDVVFLESDQGGPAIVGSEPDVRPPGAMQMMSVWPLSAIITHVVVLGVLLCFALFPVFGRPRSFARAPRSDFSKHIDSLGKLLAKTGDLGYANTRIQYYQHRIKHESGVSHAADQLADPVGGTRPLEPPPGDSAGSVNRAPADQRPP